VGEGAAGRDDGATGEPLGASVGVPVQGMTCSVVTPYQEVFEGFLVQGISEDDSVKGKPLDESIGVTFTNHLYITGESYGQGLSPCFQGIISPNPLQHKAFHVLMEA
jgi:hypothetical protein